MWMRVRPDEVQRALLAHAARDAIGERERSREGVGRGRRRANVERFLGAARVGAAIEDELAAVLRERAQLERPCRSGRTCRPARSRSDPAVASACARRTSASRSATRALISTLRAIEGVYSGRSCSAMLRVLSMTLLPVCCVVLRSISMTRHSCSATGIVAHALRNDERVARVELDRAVLHLDRSVPAST
jgi:hypothetical protein